MCELGVSSRPSYVNTVKMKVLGAEKFMPLLIPNNNRNIILCPLCLPHQKCFEAGNHLAASNECSFVSLRGVLMVSPHEEKCENITPKGKHYKWMANG